MGSTDVMDSRQVTNNLSFAALYTELWTRGRGARPVADKLSAATSFVVSASSGHVLVSARHVLSGERADTGKPMDAHARRPDFIRVRFACSDNGQVIAEPRDFDLYHDGDDQLAPRWVGHEDGLAVDVAALPVEVPLGSMSAVLDPYRRILTVADLWDPKLGIEPPRQDHEVELPLQITDRLFILGFPFGDVGTWPSAIWSTGYVSSEPRIRWDDRPAFLLDSRGRPGQSGAPVLRHITPASNLMLPDGDVLWPGTTVTVLVGVYCGRTNQQSDLAMVYTCDSIREVLARVECPKSW